MFDAYLDNFGYLYNIVMVQCINILRVDSQRRILNGLAIGP